MEAQASGGGPSRGVTLHGLCREIGRWFPSLVTQGHHSDPHPQRSPRLRESRGDQSWYQHGATGLTTVEPPMERYHRARLEIPPTPAARFSFFLRVRVLLLALNPYVAPIRSPADARPWIRPLPERVQRNARYFSIQGKYFALFPERGRNILG